jgi:hypothetical protein
MANVTTRHIVKGGELWPNETHKFGWKINYGQVWWFWVDVVGADATFEIVRTYSIKTDGVWWARVWVKNIGADFGFYNVYVATAWPMDIP